MKHLDLVKEQGNIDIQTAKLHFFKFIIGTDDFNICDLVGNDVVTHISPSSITGKQKIGEGEKTFTFMYAMLYTSIQFRAIWRGLYRHSAET